MNMMGDKINSKKIATEVNVPTIPGINHPIRDYEEAKNIAREIGYPIMLKASNGGGGRGMRIVYEESNLPLEFDTVCSESKKAFGEDVRNHSMKSVRNSRIYLRKAKENKNE